ncbi:MAG TPA: hydrogenase maturation protease [Terriglobales bacterium]|nr:hydrogenase maturation protease [Terriglobales bacterium]
MSDPLQQLEQCLAGRVCFMGLGNVDYADDGFGVRLAEALIAAGVPDVIVAGISPDRWIGRVAGFDHIVFLDAVEFGGEPGAVVFLDSAQMAARFPQISTHKISLGVLAQWAEATGTTKAWLLGVQPESLKPQQQLTPTLQNALELLCDLLKTSTDHAGTAASGCPAEGELGSKVEVNA